MGTLDFQRNHRTPPASESIEEIHKTLATYGAMRDWENLVLPILGANPSDDHAHAVRRLLDHYGAGAWEKGRTLGFDDGYTQGTAP